MLTQMKLQNFKCFNSLLLRLEPLTLLTGFNAAGKSTALQSLLLLAQSLQSGNRSAELLLNGPLARLGTPSEVLNTGSGDVIFSVEDDQADIEWTLQAKDRAEGVSMRIRRLRIKSAMGTKEYDKPKLSEMLLPSEADIEAIKLTERLREMIFLSAVRMGTADIFPSPEGPSPVHANVGVQGEFAPWWFYKFLDEKIEKARLNPSDSAETLRRQFNAWASELFPGAQGNVQAIERTNLLRLELRLGDTDDWRRPSNIGYGLTYAFPVIVAGLLAKPKQILIIDSPEAHLHPLGQSEMGRFLSKIASTGVQVIVETHSDHVLNGIRLAIRNRDIDSEKVAVHFFNRPGVMPEDSAQVISPLIDSQGNLSEWPEGFFDQSEKDLARLVGWE